MRLKALIELLQTGAPLPSSESALVFLVPVGQDAPRAPSREPSPDMSKTEDGTPDEPTVEIADASDIVFLDKTKRNPFLSMWTIGRAPTNDLWIAAGTVSKFHAYFTKTPVWTLVDQNPTNGTFIDGERLAPGDRRVLEDGCLLGFGPDVRARYFESESLVELAKSKVTSRERRSP